MIIKKSCKFDINRLTEIIYNSDAIVVGVGSGMSSASGYNHYHWTPAMEAYLQEFKDYYGLKSPFDGFYRCYSNLSEQWAYYTKYIYSMWELPTGQPYLDLKYILENREYFVLTTNIDMQCERVFPQNRLCIYQGSMGYFQCSQPCHDSIYDNKAIIKEMNDNLKGTIITRDLVPRCHKCGRTMVPWVRDDTFLEGKKWQEGIKRYHNFLNKYINKKLLFLELGVGEMSLGIIKLPFWDMVFKNTNSFYACINIKPSSPPKHLDGRSIYIEGEISETLRVLRDRMGVYEKD